MAITVTEHIRETKEVIEITIERIEPADEQFLKAHKVKISVERLSGAARAVVWAQLPNNPVEYAVLMFDKTITQTLSSVVDTLQGALELNKQITKTKKARKRT